MEVGWSLWFIGSSDALAIHVFPDKLHQEI
jgi:hypothetical protein